MEGTPLELQLYNSGTQSSDAPEKPEQARRSDTTNQSQRRGIESSHWEASTGLITRLVARLVATGFGISANDILISQRGNATIARARQLTAYLLHTGLSMTLSEIAVILSKDRTTIGHSCRVIEDLRDDPKFDDQISEFDETIKLVRLLTHSRQQEG